MIYGLVGKPGGGKSYEAVAYHVIPALESGRKVITNLPLNLDVLIAVFGASKVNELVEIRTKSLGLVKKKIDGGYQEIIGKPFESIECFSDDWRDENGKGALFLIDECHMVLGRGRTPLPITEWFSMHRHLGFDLLLITQNFRKVDNDICDMIELVYYVSKNTMLGSSKTYTKKVKDGLRGDVVNTEQRKYEKKYFKFYQSHTMSNKAVEEASANDVKSIYSHWTFKGSIIFIFLAVFIGIYNLTKSDKQPVVKQPIVKQPIVNNKDLLNKVNSSITQRNLKNDPDRSNLVGDVKNIVNDKSEQVESLNKPIQSHPFYKIQMHITGRYTVGDISGFILAASQNGQHVFDMSLKDLYLAGYSVTVLGDCNIELSYKDSFHDFITCDSPRVGLIASN